MGKWPHMAAIRESDTIFLWKGFIEIFLFSVLDVNAFERLLGPCMELMKRNINDYEQQLLQIFGSKTNISDVRWA